MHELSIVTYVIEQVEKIAKENELTDIQSVTLEFGEVSGIDDCKSTYPTVKYGKTCPHCGSGRTWLQQGQEMNIKQIEAC